MTKDFVTMKTTDNFFAPVYDPSHLTGFLLYFRARKISPRMVSHVVQTTIGEAAVPAVGRGRKRVFSLQDIALIVLGIDLLDMGLPPARVRTCVEAVRDAWPKLFSAEDLTTWASNAKMAGNKYLVAGHYPEGRTTRTFTEPLPYGFRVRFYNEKELRQKVGRYVEGPQIVYWVDGGLGMVMATVLGMAAGKHGKTIE